MRRILMIAVAAAGVAGVAAAAPVISVENGARVISVPTGEDYTLSSADVSALGSSVDLVKRGAGRLVIATNLKTAGWGGELRVEEGYLRVKAIGALGTATKGTVVSDGATLELDGSVAGANKLDFTREPLTICGEGVTENGVKMGVLRNVANDQWPGIAPVTMTGDCLYTTAKAASYRFDFRSGKVNMNGHTLTTATRRVRCGGLETFKSVAQRAQVTGTGAGVTLRNAAGETRTFAEEVTGPTAIGHAGEGTLALTGDWPTGEADLFNKDGEITVPNGNDLHVRFLEINGGTLRIKSGGLVYSHTNAYLGARWPQTARIIVERGGCYMTSNGNPKAVYPMTMGRSRNFNGTYHRGLMEIQSGASLTGRICVGTSQGAQDAAALYVRSGANFRSTGTGNSCDMYNGSGGSGYVELAGDVTLAGWTVNGVGSKGRCVWVQKGGTTAIGKDEFSIGATGARGEAYFCGGLFDSTPEIHVGKSVWSPTGTRRGTRARWTCRSRRRAARAWRRCRCRRRAACRGTTSARRT